MSVLHDNIVCMGEDGPHRALVATMVNYSVDSEDSDEELGAYIYMTSRTAQLLREEEAAAARNNELTTNDTRSKRKSPSEVENNISVSSEVLSEPKRRKIYSCNNKGCTNIVQNGGVCIRHGAKVKTCSIEGCTNNVVKGGVCIRHGAKRNRKKYTCSQEGCTNNALRRGVCMRHGATVKTCSYEGCTNQSKKGGVCIRHGAKRKQLQL